MPGNERVLKDLNAHAIATESLFDYFTDHQLSNLLFKDDLRLEGFYEFMGQMHVVISQPFINGVHPDWETLKSGLEKQGLQHEYPNSKTPSFLIDGGRAGLISVIDLHENNVLIGSESGLIHPIDAHFYFDDRASRMAVLKELGIDLDDLE